MIKKKRAEQQKKRFARFFLSYTSNISSKCKTLKGGSLYELDYK